MKTMPRKQLEEIILGVLDENPGLILDFHKPVARGEGGYHPPEGAESPDCMVCVWKMQGNANPGRANMLRKGAKTLLFSTACK
ncbi:hypothetical protein DPMN_004680 [Dreissena polymorpha]|uniref:Uncharacterized protein n=1 Tax=Dreissena polymorpha TaxID=45954 RepID=A0A9D4MNY5_DREPO|nr:hypothetical protein DPMN_004680 [Dreissena polymorpha]